MNNFLIILVSWAEYKFPDEKLPDSQICGIKVDPS
mgnify:CR=1 FL=1